MERVVDGRASRERACGEAKWKLKWKLELGSAGCVDGASWIAVYVCDCWFMNGLRSVGMIVLVLCDDCSVVAGKVGLGRKAGDSSISFCSRFERRPKQMQGRSLLRQCAGAWFRKR